MTDVAIRTGRWWPVVVLVALVAGLGVVLTSPTLLLLALPGVVVLAIAGGDQAPSGEGLQLDRTLSDSSPVPGQTVTVETTVTNTGSWPIFDLRIVDGVPGALETADGSPRHATVLGPGGSSTFSYEVTAERGRHVFDAATVRLRGPTGARARHRTLPADSPLVCEPPLDDVPLQAQTIGFTGDIATQQSGAGLEFHSVREYRPGDPARLIDWRRYARTGETAVRQFREERAASIAIVVDTRPAARWARRPTDRHAVDRAASAATQLFAALLAAGDRVGLAALGDDEFWLAPGAGREHRALGGQLLATHDALAYETEADPPELALHPGHDRLDVERLLTRLDDDTQVVLLSPLCDDGVGLAARRLQVHGHRTTVVSPTVTTERTPGQRLAGIQRRNRIVSLRAAGLSVVEWGDEPLSSALERARWSL